MQIAAAPVVDTIRPVARSDSVAAHASQPAAATVSGAVRLLNPQPVIDPALGIVVTEYFNRAGTMTSQYPTEKAIDSYRIYGLHDSNTTGPAAGTSGPAASTSSPAATAAGNPSGRVEAPAGRYDDAD